MAELPDVPSLRLLEPPPGGLAVLRERLDAPKRRWWLVALPAVALAIVVIVLASRTPRSAAPAAAPPTALRDPSVGDTFYWVASTPGGRTTSRRPTISITDVPTVEAYGAP